MPTATIRKNTIAKPQKKSNTPTLKTVNVTPINTKSTNNKKNTTKLIDVTSLKTNFFVRVSSNEDRILQFAMMYESEGLDSLPPIIVNKENEIIDGRHRFEALKLANMMQAKCEVSEETDAGNLLFMACEANMGGSLPPESKDIEMVMRKLLQQGWKRADIIAKFKPLIGAKAAQERCNWAQSHLGRMRTEQALRAIRDESMTVPAAAELYNVKIETLRELLGGKKVVTNENRIGKIKADLKQKYRGAASCSGQFLKVLFKDLEDGVITLKEINDFVEFNKTILRDQTLRLDDWEKRVNNFV